MTFVLCRPSRVEWRTYRHCRRCGRRRRMVIREEPWYGWKQYCWTGHTHTSTGGKGKVNPQVVHEMWKTAVTKKAAEAWLFWTLFGEEEECPTSISATS